MQIYQVDAFAKELFRGNPAAVVPLKEWLPDELLQKIAMENNLAETAFLVPEGNNFSIRWFTPTVEVALCGHATLASAFVLFEYLHYTGDVIVFHTRKSGDLQVSRGPRADAVAGGSTQVAAAQGQVRVDTADVQSRVDTAGGSTTTDPVPSGLLTLNFPATPALAVDPSGLDVIFEGLGVSPHPLLKGPYDHMVVLDDQQAVEQLRPNFQLLATLPGRGVVVTAPGRESDFVSRCFFPQSGIDEDPVTGSAHTMLVPYWAERLGRQKLSAIQLSARRGYLQCELAGDRVFMSGYAKTFMKGEILL